MEKRINPELLALLTLGQYQSTRFALVKYGAGIVQISGSIAGDVHARNRFGNYIRPRTKPVNPNSANQVKVRAILSTLVERWNETLSQAQRDAWILYAANVSWLNRLGETVHLTGFNHYIRGNSWRLRLDRAPVDDGPVNFVLPATDATMACTSSEATQLVTMNFDDTADWCTEDDAFLWILEGQPVLASHTFFGGPYRGRSAKGGADPGGIASPQTYGAIHVISEGQRVWNKFRIGRADGRLSTPFYTTHVVGA
ncbi:hypothetical protein KAR91_07605 [Candidatus Pacearchaeota archaeon]|nr:hypothetical protein [Candidatus Pacearchaeota archaeon]